jgi:hypothetical protein
MAKDILNRFYQAAFQTKVRLPLIEHYFSPAPSYGYLSKSFGGIKNTLNVSSM